MSIPFEGGLIGFIHLVLCIWAIIGTLNSRASNFGKALWIAFILFFPLIGFLFWLILGPKGK